MKSIYDILCCPVCWNEKLDIVGDTICCEQCSARYQIVGGIPVMIPVNKNDKWVKDAVRYAEGRDKYFQKRLEDGDGWWLPSEDPYHRLKEEHNLKCGRWKVVDDIGKNFHGIVLVDVGGGEGFVLNYLQANYNSNEILSIGYDISNVLQRDGQKRYNWENLYFLTGTNNRIALKNAVADVVISTESIEHMRDIDTFLVNINRILKKNGRLYITTPNYFGFSYWLGTIGIQYLTNIYKFITGRKNEIVNIDKNRGYGYFDDGLTFERILKFSEIEEALTKNGFRIVDVNFTQFLGQITFIFVKKLRIPIGLLRTIVKITELLEPIFNRIHLAQWLGFTQVIIAEKIGDL